MFEKQILILLQAVFGSKSATALPAGFGIVLGMRVRIRGKIVIKMNHKSAEKGFFHDKSWSSHPFLLQ